MKYIKQICIKLAIDFFVEDFRFGWQQKFFWVTSCLISITSWTTIDDTVLIIISAFYKNQVDVGLFIMLLDSF